MGKTWWEMRNKGRAKVKPGNRTAKKPETSAFGGSSVQKVEKKGYPGKSKLKKDHE